MRLHEVVKQAMDFSIENFGDGKDSEANMNKWISEQGISEGISVMEEVMGPDWRPFMAGMVAMYLLKEKS